MESSVRYVQLPNAGQKPALCFRGEKSAYAIINDGTIRTIEVDLKDYDKARIVQRLGHDYLPQAFASAVRRIAESHSVSTRARYLLEAGESSTEDQLLKIQEVVALSNREVFNEGDEEDPATGSDPRSEKYNVEPELPNEKPKVRRLGPRRLNGKGEAETVADRKRKDNLESARALKSVAGVEVKRVNGSAGGPRTADPPRKPMPIAPLPGKAAGGAKKEAKAAAKRDSGGRTLVAVLASEAGLQQQPCRVKLRAAGLRAPYDEKNEAACRKALGLPTRGKTSK